MKIIVRSPNWIGDCVMALPALRTLKLYFPQAEIYLVTKTHLRAVFQNIPEIKEIITIPANTNLKTLITTARLLRKYRIQHGLLFTNSFSSALLFRLAGIDQLTGYVKDSRKWLLQTALSFPADNFHHVYFYLGLVAVFLEQVTDIPPHSLTSLKTETPLSPESSALIITETERKTVLQHLEDLGLTKGRIWVGIAPAAAYGSSKQWLLERWQNLIKKINQEYPQVQLLLFGTGKEHGQIAHIMDTENQQNTGHVFNLAGALSLRETMVTISMCHVFIANDSGLMHVASSLDVPLMALFGPTRPEKTAPRHDKAIVLHYPPSCAPCLARVCPLPDHPCMTAITVEEVMAKLRKLLPGQ